MLTDYNLYTNSCDEKKIWELTNHITSALNAQRKSAGPHARATCGRSVRIRNTHIFSTEENYNKKYNKSE